MKNQFSKLDTIKINIRKSFLQYTRNKINDIQPGDLDKEEYEMFRQELLEIADFLTNKDKYIEAMQYYKTHRNKNLSKYFKELE